MSHTEKNEVYNFLQESIKIHHLRIYPITFSSKENYVSFKASLIPENYHIIEQLI